MDKETPPALAEYIKTCCRRNPDERYPDAHTALKVLEKLYGEKRLTVRKTLPDNMVSLFLFHEDEQKDEVTKLLEEFVGKVGSKGIGLILAEFSLEQQSKIFLTLANQKAVRTAPLQQESWKDSENRLTRF